MATPNPEPYLAIEPTQLSRAVSEIDLNAALRTLESKRAKIERTNTYTAEEIIRFRTGYEKNPIDPAEFETISKKPDLHGIVTPPFLGNPRVPPPTPTTPARLAAPILSIHPPTPPDSRSPPAPATPVDDEEAPKTEAAIENGAGNGTEKPKKKKKKKSSGKNKKTPPTGYEEYYADPPMTPAEHAEETWLYGEAYPFDERIQTCIQRYRARRKLDESRSNVLTKYLMLGGVEASPKAFNGGLDKQTLENSTAAEIAAIQATDYVKNSVSNNAKFYDGSKNWVVDFTGVVKGFFSYRYPHYFAISTEEILKTHVGVIRNFLNYVLLHAVCPEYTEDVMAAKKICDLAEKELWAITQIGKKMPGEFNVAASTLYGGQFNAIPDTPMYDWDERGVHDQSFGTTRRLSMMDAERIFKTCICLASPDDMLVNEILKPNVRIVKSEYKAYEVIGIERSEAEIVAQYNTVKDVHGAVGNIKPLGVIRLKAWKGTRVLEPDADEQGTVNAEIESFWLEDEILELCFTGLKLEVIVHELNFGWRFFDRVEQMHCSFYTYLHNEKMFNWKDPLPNDRGPPTEEDIDEEEEDDMNC